jgi:hypothetical protein
VTGHQRGALLTVIIRVEIDNSLLANVRETAQREGVTLCDLIEEGLKIILEQRRQKSIYRWPDLSVSGEGLVSGLEAGDWKTMRDRIY